MNRRNSDASNGQQYVAGVGTSSSSPASSLIPSSAPAGGVSTSMISNSMTTQPTALLSPENNTLYHYTIPNFATLYPNFTQLVNQASATASSPTMSQQQLLPSLLQLQNLKSELDTMLRTKTRQMEQLVIDGQTLLAKAAIHSGKDPSTLPTHVKLNLSDRRASLDNTIIIKPSPAAKTYPAAIAPPATVATAVDGQLTINTKKRNRNNSIGSDGQESDDRHTKRKTSGSEHPLSPNLGVGKTRGDAATATPNATMPTLVPPVTPSQVKNDKAVGKKNSNTQIKKQNRVAEPYPMTTTSNEKPPQAGDFTRVKPAQQTPIANFWAHIDPYFRPLDENDLQRLVPKIEDETPSLYLIPPLEQHYKIRWAKEDQQLIPDDTPQNELGTDEDVSTKTINNDSTTSAYFALNNDGLMAENNYCGPLTERIMSALLEQDLLPPSAMDPSDGTSKTTSNDDDTEGRMSSPIASFNKVQDMQDLESRVKRELQFLGIIDDQEIDWNAREDDEICTEMRKEQATLRSLQEDIRRRKQILYDIAVEHMAYQEYQAIVEELDKQIELAYIKRYRNKKKKKATATGAPIQQQQQATPTLSEATVAIIKKRQRILEEFAPIFPPEKFKVPTRSIYQKDDNAIENDNDNNEDDDDDDMTDASTHEQESTPSKAVKKSVTQISVPASGIVQEFSLVSFRSKKSKDDSEHSMVLEMPNMDMPNPRASEHTKSTSSSSLHPAPASSADPTLSSSPLLPTTKATTPAPVSKSNEADKTHQTHNQPSSAAQPTFPSSSSITTSTSAYVTPIPPPPPIRSGMSTQPPIPPASTFTKTSSNLISQSWQASSSLTNTPTLNTTPTLRNTAVKLTAQQSQLAAPQTQIPAEKKLAKQIKYKRKSIPDSTSLTTSSTTPATMTSMHSVSAASKSTLPSNTTNARSTTSFQAVKNENGGMIPTASSTPKSSTSPPDQSSHHHRPARNAWYNRGRRGKRGS